MAIFKGTQKPFKALHSETLCSPSNSLPPTTLLTLWDGGKDGMQPGNVFCVDCGARLRGIREAAIQGERRLVKEESWGARYTEKGKCHSWRRNKQETDRKRRRGIGKVNPESPLFYVVWSILLGWEKGFWPNWSPIITRKRLQHLEA